MKLVVAYLATTGGEDAVAVAVRLARTLGAQLDICMVLPPDRASAGLVPAAGYQDMLAEQAQNGWPMRRRWSPTMLPPKPM